MVSKLSIHQITCTMKGIIIILNDYVAMSHTNIIAVFPIAPEAHRPQVTICNPLHI